MQRDLIKPLRIPYQDPSTRVDSSPNQSNSATSRLINVDTKPAAFMLSSNVSDNYSAYRLNSNMGLSSTPDGSRSKMRTGFFGEMYSSQDQRPHRQQYAHSNSQSVGKSPFYQNGASVVASTNWSNPYPGYAESPMYNQQYTGKPSQFSHQNAVLNSPYNYQKYPDPHQNMLLSPVYRSPPQMYHPRRQQSVSHSRPQNEDDGFAKVERLFMVQTKHLESLIRNYDRSDSGSNGDQSLLSRSGLNDPNKIPGSRKNSGVPHYPKILNDGHTPNHGQGQGHAEPPRQSIHGSSRNSPVENHGNNEPDEIKDVEGASPDEDAGDKGDKKKKKKKDKKASGLKLRYALWAVVYPTLLNKVVEKQVEDKKKSGQGTSEQVKELNAQVIEFIKKHCSAPLEAFYKDSKSMIVIADGKKITDKDLSKAFTAMTERLVAIMKALNAALTEENLPKSFVSFFSSISKNFVVLPKSFLSEYEIFCMEFSHYGTVKNMNPYKVKLLIGMYVLVKGLIYTFLTQPWTVFPKHKKSANFSKKLKNCSSVLYHVAMDYFKENLQAIKNNQAFLAPEKRLKPTKDPLVSFVDSADAIQALQSAGPLEVIQGLYNRESLIECWTSQRDSVAILKPLVEECLEKLCTIVQDAQSKDKK